MQDAAGIEYVDLGADFAERAHEIHWATLMEANPEVVGKLRGLLTK